MQNQAESLYILENRAWPCWYKLGRTCDLYDTLKVYNRGAPFADYSFIHTHKTYSIISQITEFSNILLKHSTKTHYGWYFIPGDITYVVHEIEKYVDADSVFA